MKTKIAAALFAVAAMLTTACEQHKWESTSKLFKGHAEHGKAGDKKAGEHDAPAKH